MAKSDAVIVDAGERDLRVSSADRVIFPETERSVPVTKLDIVEYYLAVEDGIMRALERRPTTLERWPKGVHPGIVLSTREKGGGDAFFQKRIPRGAPDYVQTARIEFPSGRHADEICPTEVAVVGWAAQMGTITFHPWPVRSEDVDHPDELRLDLDPQPGTDFVDAVRVAAEARVLLDDLGYVGFPKTSGGRGVHIYVRIEPRWTFTDVRHAAIAFGRELERRLPGQVTTKWWKEERGERIFVDYNQNARDRTIASAYSVRPKPGAPVSAPVTWDELSEVAPEDFTVATMPARFAEVGDRHAAIDEAAHSLEPLLDMYERDEAQGDGDMPYPPDYPKMPGEPKRVQPSRDRDRKKTEARRLRQLLGAAPGHRRRRRRHDRPDVPVGRLVQVDDHRRVVARAAALAGLPVHPRRLDSAGDRLARQHQVDPHPEVLMEHPRPVVPVGEHALVRPAVAHDVAQAERLQLRQRLTLGRCHVGLADVGVGIEHVVVGRRDVHVAAHDRRLGAGGDHLPQRRQPGELVLVVLGVRLAPVRHVNRDHPDPVARGRHRARLRMREARRAGDSRHDVVQPHAREDRDAVPGRLAVRRDLVAALGELVAEQLGERVVGELGLLQADHVRPPLVQPGQQPRHALLDRVDVPGRDSHRLHGTRADGARSSRSPVDALRQELGKGDHPLLPAPRGCQHHVPRG